jgi:uncharacterized repeat protein (TIGR01451 family)
VTVSAALPAATVSFMYAFPNLGTYDQATGVWDLGTVEAGFQAVLSLQAVVLSSGRRNATVSSLTSSILPRPTRPDPSAGNNSCRHRLRHRVPVICSWPWWPMTAPPTVGGTVVLTATLTNAGPDTATGRVRDRVAARRSDLRLAPLLTRAAMTQATGLWDGGHLERRCSAVDLVIQATVAASVAGQNVVCAAEVTALDQSDTASGNDSDSVTLAVPAIPGSDIGLAVALNDATADEGQTVTFTLTATNYGLDDLTTGSVTVTVPAGFSVDSATRRRVPTTAAPASGPWAPWPPPVMPS